MAILRFPPIDTAQEDGMLAIGGDLETPSLLMAYSQGIFPWPISEEYPLVWFSPDPRGVLYYNNFHVSKSFKKTLKRDDYKITFNQAFDEVMKECANHSNRKNQDSTWITNEMLDSFSKLHKQKNAYSVEVWSDKKELIGGLYGVIIGHYITGESMFYRQTDASKLALYYLMEHLNTKGISWIDTQMVTPVIENLGGIEISRDEFIKMLKTSIGQGEPQDVFKFS